jgi:hypothetical protein
MKAALGVQADSNIPKAYVAKSIVGVRASLLELEDLYYSFRDDIENLIQDIKYRLDTLTKLTGDNGNVD